ncbi:hypothetical protein ACOMHN_053282 [Nucella lapillus]
MATGTKLMKEISDQFLICKLCQESFKEPKTLSCLHTFCCACVQQQYDEESNRPTRYTLYIRSVTCPLCRKKTELPTGGVRRLPDNFLVSNLTDVLAKRCMAKVPPCEICHMVRPRSNDACSKCLDCDKFLCRACVELHSTTKVTQDHSLIDVEGQKDIECKAHPEETVRFYCERCEECICVVCTFQEHKDHEVCSFNDGFAKHKVTLESLLTKSKARLTDMGSRLKVIEKYEHLSKDLKETIRDLAISYTSQVRAREKELIQQVDQLFGSREVTQLAENKAWLQETFDSLQSACNLTEIVMRDKGVEMLLLKKEIQGKMDHLLQTSLPPEPPDVKNLDVKFVPGEVKLGEVFIPKPEDDTGKVGGKALTNGVSNGDLKSATSLQSIDDGSGKPCEECVERKRKDAEEARAHKRHSVKDGEKQAATKSVHIQTVPQDRLYHNGYSTASQQISHSPSGIITSHNSIPTYGGVPTQVPNLGQQQQQQSHTQNGNRAQGTMTERQDVRTLKIQTEESCLRDTHLGQAAATGSTYPNTGAAIAAAFLRHKASDEESLTHSWPTRGRTSTENHQAFNKQTQDAEVSTDISLTLSTNLSQTLTALCGAGGAGSLRGVQQSSDRRRPDLLAETGSAASAAPPRSPSVKIRSRKIQTEISSMSETADKSGDKFISDSELRRSVCLAPGSANCPRPPVSRATTVTATPHTPARPTKHDASVMTPFKVKIVPSTAEKSTTSDEVTSHTVGMMTSQETRTVYIQTRGPRVVSMATGTDFEGQMSKSTSTLHVVSVDAETAMPQVSHESRTTWTEPVATSERATSTGCSSSTDAATLTSKIQTSDFAVQMRPVGVAACVNTTAPKLVHRPAQTCPSMSTKATMPDPLLSPPTPTPTPPHPPASSTSTSQSNPRPLSMSSVPVVTPGLLCPVAADKATETVPSRCVSRAAGPNVLMQASRTTSTDTVSLLQVTDKETATPTIKTVDDWTHTPQPQMISTGVTPPRPAVLEVGVATVPITLMDQATYTEVTTTRESGIETCMVVCDSETLTDRTVMCDAQTEIEISTEHEGTTMAGTEVSEGGCMTEQGAEEPASPSRLVKDNESQCQTPALVNKEVNTSNRHRRRVKEVQTTYSYTECLLCQHPDKLEKLGLNKTFTDTSTDPTPPDTHDVATMALSCLASSPGLINSGVQTSIAELYDKSATTSFDFEEELATRPFLAIESQDAATSTESLPYIGLLSEIDVDELIVIPEANFELVLDSDLEYCHVPMVDGETLTEVLDYAEVGTQTLQPVLSGETSTEQNPPEICHEEDFSKHLSSIGVNTLPRVTFEKETSTPIQHLFSKGTMTFFVTKMDKATSTISYARPKTDGSTGQAGGGTKEGRTVKDSGKQKQMDNKLTMTTRTEQRDVAVETDSSVVDGRITECISKLRNVSERLNSPTARKHSDSEAVSEQLPPPQKQNETLHPPIASKPPPSPKVHRKETCPPQGADNTVEEHQRHRQAQSFLVDAGVVLRPKDPSPVRKAQPITTLKPRTPVTPGDLSNYASRSLPRQGSLERQNKVKMGSQVSPTSRLPLLRYNSAPGRIATVPTQTLLQRSGATSPRTSPSKIPISQKPAPAPGSPVVPTTLPLPDSDPESDSVSTSSSQKVQQRPSLPSITETNTPSSCLDPFFPSMDSVEPSTSLDTAMVSCHSRSPSNVGLVSDTPCEGLMTGNSANAVSANVEGDGDDSSVNSASMASASTPAQAVSSSSESLSKQKKEKKGFMQRLLSGKKKKKESSEKDPAPKQDSEKDKKKQQVAPSPKLQRKQAKPEPAQGAKSKSSQKSTMTVPLSQTAPVSKPSSPISTPASSKPPSTDPTYPAVKDNASAGPPSPPQPPHHYPPLPDPNAPPPVPKKPRPFVYVRQRILSIQQDNVEEVQEKKEKEKEDKEKGKPKEKWYTREIGIEVYEMANNRLWTSQK